MNISVIVELLLQNWHYVLTFVLGCMLVWNVVKMRKDNKINNEQDIQIKGYKLQIEEQKFRLELYGYQRHLYNSIVRILSLIIHDTNVSDKDLSEFKSATAKVGSLFDLDVRKFIDEIYFRALNINNINKEYSFLNGREEIPVYDRFRIDREKEEQQAWAFEQLYELYDKLNKYSHVNKSESEFII